MALTITCKTEVLLFATLFNMLLASLHATTNQPDVSAVQNLFTSMNSATTLKGWSSNGTDPCSDMWEGITCLNQAVTEIHLSGLNLTGRLGYRLDQLTSLTILDLSNNQLSGGLPYQFPPNVQQLNLGNNNFSGSGGFPYSFMSMSHLTSLNMSNNRLSGEISDVFWHFQSLITIDLSFNNLTGGLPHSISNLSAISVMYLQNNVLTGDVNVLASLPLQDLNLENNQFTGWIPSSFNAIPDLRLTGNNFNTGPAPSPPPLVAPSPGQTPNATANNNNGSTVGDLNQQSTSPDGRTVSPNGSSSSLSTGAVAGISIAGVLAVSTVAFIIIMFCFKPQERSANKNNQQTLPSIAIQRFSIPPARVSVHKDDGNLESQLHEATLKPPPADSYKRPNNQELHKKSPRRNDRSLIAATTYSIADLQVATSSFSEENLLGVGTYGAVYKAKLQDQDVAVKKLETSHPDFPNGERKMELISSISHLHHPNITQFVGYCLEHGQCLLVYDYIELGSLHDILHSSYDTRLKLTWSARVKIALGAARALEYLHEVCQPPVVHRSFKSTNILLDEELNPHVSDSGIATFMQTSERQASSRMTGSSSFCAPEHAMYGVYTTKTDIYGFGVVMLELLTGRIPFDSTKPRNEKSLVRWATPQLHDIDALTSMVDTAFKGQYPVKSLSRFADIISLCIQPEPEFRPMMSEVVQSLMRLMQRASLSKRRLEDDVLPE